MDIEAGDIVVVLRDGAYCAHSPHKSKESIQAGEKVHVEIVNSENMISYKLQTGRMNSLVIDVIEKIYYNDIFKAAWFFFGGRP